MNESIQKSLGTWIFGDESGSEGTNEAKRQRQEIADRDRTVKRGLNLEDVNLHIIPACILSRYENFPHGVESDLV
jgi:hypothetical protein